MQKDNRKIVILGVQTLLITGFYIFILITEVKSLASFCGITLLVVSTGYIATINIYYSKPGQFEKFTLVDIPKNQLKIFIGIFCLLSFVGLCAVFAGI